MAVPERHAVDRDVDAQQRIRRRDRPVAAEREPGAGVEQRPEDVLLLPRGGTQERQRQVGHLVVEAGPQRLGVGRDVELGEARHVLGPDDLDVREVVAIAASAVDRDGVLDRIEAVAHGTVTERVDVDLEVLGVEQLDVARQVGRPR